MSNDIQFFGKCVLCGCGRRGVTDESSECSNTDCNFRRAKHGLQLATAGRDCAECNQPLWAGMDAAFCPNETCGRYLRQQ